MGDQREDISETTAPSIDPDTVIEKEDPENRLARHEQSDVDAMGLDKRRGVIGGQYSPSIGRQAVLYGVFLAIVAVVAIGLVIAVNEFDQPPDRYEDLAPWAQQGAEQVKPAPLDYPRNGNPGPGQ